MLKGLIFVNKKKKTDLKAGNKYLSCFHWDIAPSEKGLTPWELSVR